MNDQDRLFVQAIIQETVKETVKETIRELKRAGMLKNGADLAYTEATALLRGYYKQGETDKAVAKALSLVSSDPYYKIIPLYFSYGYTIEEIAEVFSVEISTISRNKKRLCLEVYKHIE